MDAQESILEGERSHLFIGAPPPSGRYSHSHINARHPHARPNLISRVSTLSSPSPLKSLPRNYSGPCIEGCLALVGECEYEASHVPRVPSHVLAS